MSGVETVRSFYTTWLADRWDDLEAGLHPQVELHIPGSNPFSGVHRGRNEVLTVLRHLRREVGSTMELELISVEGFDRYVSVVGYQSYVSPDGAPFKGGFIEVFELEDGMWRGIWEYNEHLEETRSFFAGFVGRREGDA